MKWEVEPLRPASISFMTSVLQLLVSVRSPELWPLMLLNSIKAADSHMFTAAVGRLLKRSKSVWRRSPKALFWIILPFKVKAASKQAWQWGPETREGDQTHAKSASLNDGVNVALRLPALPLFKQKHLQTESEAHPDNQFGPQTEALTCREDVVLT